MKKKEPTHFVVCLDNKGYPASLEMGKYTAPFPTRKRKQKV